MPDLDAIYTLSLTELRRFSICVLPGRGRCEPKSRIRTKLLLTAHMVTVPESPESSQRLP
jgi:hypothetical protein